MLCHKNTGIMDLYVGSSWVEFYIRFYSDSLSFKQFIIIIVRSCETHKGLETGKCEGTVKGWLRGISWNLCFSHLFVSLKFQNNCKTNKQQKNTDPDFVLQVTKDQDTS